MRAEQHRRNREEGADRSKRERSDEGEKWKQWYDRGVKRKRKREEKGEEKEEEVFKSSKKTVRLPDIEEKSEGD